MSTLYVGIGELVTNDPAQGDGSALGIVEDGAVLVEGGSIAWVGRRVDAPAAGAARVDWGGASVIPGFVDSHAHLVFAGERSAEFAARMSGEPYAAGGIATTVAATRAADDATLSAGVERLANELLRAGVTTFETKSGYGLTVDDEARSLAVAQQFTSETTFLGAHVVPADYRDNREGYVELVTGPMLAACRGSARWVDVFCDRGAFDVDESRVILTAGMVAGLQARVHAGANSGQATVFGWRSRSAPRRSTIAPTPPTPTSRRSRQAQRSRRFCRAPSFPPGPNGRTRAG